jgi:hypothetical protein
MPNILVNVFIRMIGKFIGIIVWNLQQTLANY